MAAITPAPAPEPSVPAGSRVVVVVSRGPAPGPRHGAAPVPELVGREQGDALHRIQDVGLNAEVFNDFSATVRRGHVVEQFPAAGSSVAVNSEVVVLVSSGPAEKTAPTPLPDVVGLHETEALARLQAAGLESEVARDFHPNAEEGVVLAQLPSQAAAASTHKQRRSLAWLWIVLAVVLVVAAAFAAFYLLLGKQVIVPNVTARQQALAEQALTAADLKVGDVSSVISPNVPPGIVIRQAPEAGVEVNAGSSIDLVVAGVVPVVKVPNTVGMIGSDANAAVTAAGFVTQISNVFSSTVPKGAVISQSPAAGSTAPKGSTVIVTVSLGPSTPNVTLPDFTGMTQTDAVNKALALGLKTRVSSQYNTTVVAGQVVDQLPAAGVIVPTGTTIGLSISLGPAPAGSVTVPDLKGQGAATAQNALTTLGLVIATVDWDGTGQPAGTVVGQSPKAGEQVPTGSSVLVFVSSGK